METHRYGSFETNSSSEHTMTYNKEARTADELPALTADGNLDLEVTRFWHCGGPGCCTDNLRDIIEYLMMTAFNAGRINDADYSYAESVAAFKNQIKELYMYLGATPPNDITAYFLDINGNRHPYTGDSCLREFSAFVNQKRHDGERLVWLDGEWHFLDEDEFLREFYPAHKDDLDKGVWSMNCIGIASGLSWCSYQYHNGHFYDCYDEDDNNLTSWDLLTTKSELRFIHT